jgi:hypothetical protein
MPVKSGFDNMGKHHFILVLERRLRAVVSLSEQRQDVWLLAVDLFYEEKPVGKTSFNLNGYTEDEAVDVARNLGSNSYLMKEIDDFLWGESD